MTQPPMSVDAAIAVCQEAQRLAPASYPPDLPEIKWVDGASPWYPFEHGAWAMGEMIRASMRTAPELKRSADVLKAVLEVIRCRNLRRGRQPFVTLLGFVAARPHAPVLAELLTDRDVNGHVAATLLKMHADGYGRAVRPLADSKDAWVKKSAKAYLERYPATKR